MRIRTAAQMAALHLTEKIGTRRFYGTYAFLSNRLYESGA